MIHGSVRRTQVQIFAVVSRQLPQWLTLGFLVTQVFETTDEIVRKIRTKSAYDAVSRSHEIKSRGRASIPLIDGKQAPAVVIAVQGFNALEHKVKLIAHAICHSNSSSGRLTLVKYYDGRAYREPLGVEAKPDVRGRSRTVNRVDS
jgi:hypothetical protein